MLYILYGTDDISFFIIGFYRYNDDNKVKAKTLNHRTVPTHSHFIRKSLSWKERKRKKSRFLYYSSIIVQLNIEQVSHIILCCAENVSAMQ